MTAGARIEDIAKACNPRAISRICKQARQVELVLAVGLDTGVDGAGAEPVWGCDVAFRNRGDVVHRSSRMLDRYGRVPDPPVQMNARQRRPSGHRYRRGRMRRSEDWRCGVM